MTNQETQSASKTGSPLVEPGTQKFLDALAAQGGPPIYKLPVPEARAVLSGAQAGNTPRPQVDIEDRSFPVGPTGKVDIRILRPKGNKAVLPVVVFVHGAGWVLGGKDTHDRLVREIVDGAQVAVIFVEYDRSPEARFPVAIEQSYAAMKFVAENSKELNVDPSRLAVAGDSVGGNMATALTLMAKRRGGPKISFQLLFYPVTAADFDNASYQQFAEGHFLTREAMKWFWNQYLPDEAARKVPLASPLLATIEELRGLPPALVINGECDVLRDEGEAYAHKLAQAGVRVTAVRFHGTIHDFVMLNALADTPAARGATALANDTLRRVFAK